MAEIHAPQISKAYLFPGTVEFGGAGKLGCKFALIKLCDEKTV
jgi:hypothetical protein